MKSQQPASRRRPTFLWQGLLIVLPVIVMAGYCFIALRQDKLVARQEAVQRATALAEDLLPKIRAALEPDVKDGTLDGRCLAVDSSGGLLFPAPYSNVPTPQPLDVTELNTEQARLWRACEAMGGQSKDGPAREAPLKAFLETVPPKRFAAAAQYRLGLLLAERNRIEEADEAFTLIFQKFPYVLNENGVAWRVLAGIKLLELEARSPAGISSRQRMRVDPLCQEVIGRPTALTPYLLETIQRLAPDASGWGRIWENEELLRDLYSVSRENFASDAFAAIHPTNATSPLLSPALVADPLQMQEMFWVAAPRPVWETNFTTDNKGLLAHPIELKDEHWLLIHWDEAADLVPKDEMKRVLRELTTLRNETANISEEKATITLKPARNRNRFILNTPLKAEAAVAEPSDISTNHWYVYRTEGEIGSRISAVLKSAGSIPNYFGVEVRVAGRRLTKSMPDLHLWERVPYAGKPGGVRRQDSREVSTNLLASAVRQVQGKELLAVNVLLTSPSVLFERQTTRSFWIGTLIGISALAALTGLAAAWRAFQRQIQLTEMKSQFVSSVSHELRAPIASVRLLAESLERGKIQQPEKQNEYFRFIGQECRRLSALIENVLDFSRIDQGRKQYELEPTDLIGLVEQTVRLMETYAAEKQVKLTLVFAEDIAQARPQPQVDGKAIQQALVNLVDNAIKHSAAGQTVIVGLERDKEEQKGPLNDVISKPRWRLWVEDRGPGIPVEEQVKIFERFYRCGSELRPETQGVGIGLSIVKHIVESHGGRVLVESVVGEGSRFIISLPAAPESE